MNMPENVAVFHVLFCQTIQLPCGKARSVHDLVEAASVAEPSMCLQSSTEEFEKWVRLPKLRIFKPLQISAVSKLSSGDCWTGI